MTNEQPQSKFSPGLGFVALLAASFIRQLDDFPSSEHGIESKHRGRNSGRRPGRREFVQLNLLRDLDWKTVRDQQSHHHSCIGHGFPRGEPGDFRLRLLTASYFWLTE